MCNHLPCSDKGWVAISLNPKKRWSVNLFYKNAIIEHSSPAWEWAYHLFGSPKKYIREIEYSYCLKRKMYKTKKNFFLSICSSNLRNKDLDILRFGCWSTPTVTRREFITSSISYGQSKRKVNTHCRKAIILAPRLSNKKIATPYVYKTVCTIYNNFYNALLLVFKVQIWTRTLFRDSDGALIQPMAVLNSCPYLARWMIIRLVQISTLSLT